MVFKNTLFLSLSYGVLILSVFLTVLFFVIFIILRKKRDKISTFEIENMSKEAYILSKKIKALFSDKYIIDVLKFSNLTRFGYEIPKDRKSTRLNSSHANISYAVFCLKKKILISTR